MNEWQHFCLEEMQITRWVLQAKPEALCHISLNLPLSGSEKTLLAAMLKYKGLTLKDVQFISSKAEITTGFPIWVFADKANETPVLLKKNLLETMSLKTLLQNPLAKKEVFKALQAWKI
ncbi:MAG: hypothetical protein A3F18_07300 [Legionellales bacterium RIFCSPHIGHO2_12_FULL_37_14]|nr:MAG: hypothetical protein A3F18_07300 [Legionellales bacterium RIFCSPHIGHO2_12_FULL_37_14]